MVDRLGIRTTIHKLRHYSATELIRAGVDLRTVGGRLGHAEGGTTLAFYVAWVREADQRACRNANRSSITVTIGNCGRERTCSLASGSLHVAAVTYRETEKRLTMG